MQSVGSTATLKLTREPAIFVQSVVGPMPMNWLLDPVRIVNGVGARDVMACRPK